VPYAAGAALCLLTLVATKRIARAEPTRVPA
jgi:hypothetical protein